MAYLHKAQAKKKFIDTLSYINDMKIINWGIIGLGNIARSFASDFQYVTGGTILGAASRSMNKAREFCSEFNIPKAYGNYTDLIKDPDIEVIYIATPHNLHFQNSIDCLRAGKAVLCEKPITIDSGELDTLIKEHKLHKTYLMEAMWTYFLPPIQKVKQWLRNGKIGELKYITANFAFNAPYNPENRLFNPDLAGGALLDIGIYPIALALLVTGAKPLKTHVMFEKANTGVDIEETMIFEYENGLKANLHASFGYQLPNDALIVGSKGYIKIPDFFKCRECSLIVDDQLKERFVDDRPSKGYNYEIEAVQQDLRTGKVESAIMPLKTSLELQNIMGIVKSKF